MPDLKALATRSKGVQLPGPATRSLPETKKTKGCRSNASNSPTERAPMSASSQSQGARGTLEMAWGAGGSDDSATADSGSSNSSKLPRDSPESEGAAPPDVVSSNRKACSWLITESSSDTKPGLSLMHDSLETSVSKLKPPAQNQERVVPARSPKPAKDHQRELDKLEMQQRSQCRCQRSSHTHKPTRWRARENPKGTWKSGCLRDT